MVSPPSTGRSSFLLATLLALAAPAAGQPGSPGAAAWEPPCPPGHDPGALVVGEVAIVRRDVFDPGRPGEDRRLFRLANRLHRNTREGVVARQLLFASGDPFVPGLLAESERLLRANPYFYDARVRPVRCADGRVDVEVVTRDVWTLQGGVAFSRAGGESSTDLELQDTNFLGTGKDLTLAHRTSVDRDLDLLRYRDPNLFGTRGRTELWYEDRSDGSLELATLERPFYSLDARWAAGLRLVRDDRVTSLYEAGHVFDRFRSRRELLEVQGGWSPGLESGAARRFRLGFTRVLDRFGEAPGGLAGEAPPERTLAYPWIGFERVEDGYVLERDLDRLQRTEDLNLGSQLALRLGWSSPTFGAGDDRLIVQGSAAAGWRPGPRQLLLASGSVRSRLWQGAEDLLAGGRLRYYRRNVGGRDHLLYALLETQVARELDPEDQLLLGGDTGLRGYPLRYQSGDRRLLLTLEQRFFGDREIFHLLHVGGAVFLDMGRAWFAGARDGRGNPWLRDVGLGLRLGSSRSSRGSVVHLDLAFPLDGDRSIENVQWLVTTGETF